MFGWFVRHPVAANLLMIALCLLGLASVGSIKRETFPDISSSVVAVTVAYPGASASDVADEVCAPIEDALTGTTGLAEITCLALDGVAQASVELEEGGNEITFYNDVFSSVSGINDFPTDTETPLVKLQSGAELVAMLAVSGIDGKEGLIRYADTLADRLQQLDGVTEARVSGITDRELRVSFDELALRRYGLSAKDIVGAINARSLRLPLGAMQTDEQSLTLKYADTRRDKGALEDLIILQTASGGVVRLQDVATVNLIDLDENQQSFINGKQAAIINIFKTTEADAIRTYNRVEQVLDEERAKYPAPFDLTVNFNMTDLVNERLNLILKNTVIGLVLVFGTMWLFFTLRDALWIAAALPVSFLGTMFFMSSLGISINMITLVALLMAVGLIMDDSIVIAENIALWRKRAGQREAATRGLLEVIPGVTSSFLTTACVFGPLMFLAGDMGRVLQFIPMVLLLTLALSLVEGFLILPHHLSGGHGPDNPDNSHNRPAARAIEAFKEKVVIPLAATFVKVRYLTVGGVIAALILSFGLVTSGQVKVVGFPAIEGDTVRVKLALTTGIDRARTVQTVAQLTSALDRVNARLTPNTVGQEPLVQRVLVQYATNSDVNDNGSNAATLTVDLLESSKRNVRADDVLSQWRAEAGPIPDLVQISFSQAELGPGGSDIDIRISGRELAKVDAAGTEMLSRLLARDDVSEAFVNFYGGQSEARLSLNAYGSAIGLTPQILADQLRQAFSGSETDNFRSGLSTVTVRVELDNAVDSLTKLEQFPISVGGGKLTDLATVADINLTTSYPAIQRRNGLTEANILGQIDRSATTATAIAAFAVEQVGPELETRYPGISIDIGGASEDQAKSQASMMSKLLLGLAGVYLILAFQFRSYTLPFVVMLSIPFALIGTILGHWLMGIDLAMPSFIGFASLAGIVVNNAILFLTFFQSHLKDEDHVTAALDALRDRFRPILLSTGTTVIGLIPLISDGSPQVQVMVPLVLSVAAGLTASMILVVLVLPSLLTIYFDVFSVRKWIGKFDVSGPRQDVGTAPDIRSES